MCPFTGSQHRGYSPSRSATRSYCRRLPTIFEATDVEMARESDANEEDKELERKETDTEKLLGKRLLTPPLKTSKKSKTVRQRCKVSSREPSTTETNVPQLQEVQDEWCYFLRTPYADFFPENITGSILDLDAGFLSITSSKKKQIKSTQTDPDAHRLSEVAAWLEFFG